MDLGRFGEANIMLKFHLSIDPADGDEFSTVPIAEGDIVARLFSTHNVVFETDAVDYMGEEDSFSLANQHSIATDDGHLENITVRQQGKGLSLRVKDIVNAIGIDYLHNATQAFLQHWLHDIDMINLFKKILMIG